MIVRPLGKEDMFMSLSFEQSLKKNAETAIMKTKNIETIPVVSMDDISVADTSIMTLDETPMIAAYSGDDGNWQQHNGYVRYSVFSDDNISVITDTKDINLDGSQFNITQEENSQYIPFEMPRYYDGYDLVDAAISVHYTTKNGRHGASKPINVTYNNNKIRFGWLVDASATIDDGALEFEIHAYGAVVGSDGISKAYTWKTKSNKTLKVLKSMCDCEDVINDIDDSWIQELVTDIAEKVASQIAEANVEGQVIRAENAAVRAETAANNAASVATTTVTNALKNYSTTSEMQNYVKSEIANADIEGKLTEYAKTSEVNALIGNVGEADNVIDYVDTAVASVDVSEQLKDYALLSDLTNNYYTKTDTEQRISVVLEDYATKQNVADAIAEADISDKLENYYKKEETYNKDEIDLALDNVSVDLTGYATEKFVTDKTDVLSSSVSTNTENISSLSSVVSDLQNDVNSIDKSPRLTYDVVYNDTDNPDIGENGFGFYEIKNEGLENEERTLKQKFTITGGSGGASGALKIGYVTTSPLVVTANDNAVIKYTFSGTDSSGDIVTEGIATWKVAGRVVATNTAIAGENEFDVTKYISIGTQKINLTIKDEAGNLATKTWTVQKIDVRLESTFDDTLTYPIGSVSFNYTPYGAVSKDIHFILDGEEIGKVTTSSSGVPMAYEIPAQEHGAHLLEVYITAEINGNHIEPEHIFKDILWYDDASEVPVIGTIYQNFTARQYDSTNIKYTVYDPSTVTPTVEISVNGKVVSTPTLEMSTNVYTFKTDVIGEHIITITCGETVKTIKANITKLDIDVTPVTSGMAFDFNPTGKSNNDADRVWTDGNVSMSVSDNFDWVNGGYQYDENGDQFFCVKAGTTATIDYQLFADDAKVQGKEFKVVFKTSNIKKRDTTFVSCMDNGIGLDMKVENARVYSSNNNLYSPYCEEDIIEFEFNISASNDIPLVMTYEDGVGNRPMIYTSDASFWQSNPQPITIGSDNCDVYIYRMKAYTRSLSDSEILSNFILDARNANDMVDRYNRNQIYDNQDGVKVLTPEGLAKACPDLRVIMIDAPWFTNDKDNKVDDTTIRMIYTNGRPEDNWTCTGARHSGQGTSSNEYGYAGRNIDLIMDTDTALFTFDDSELEPSKTITLTETSVPTDYLNVKVNIASSENENNAQMARRYNQYNPFKRSAKFNDSKVKDCMEFYNCVIFVKERDTDISTHREFQDNNYHFYGIGNVGDSKKTDDTRVNNKKDYKEHVVEITDYNVPLAEFPTGNGKDICSVADWKEGNVAYDYLYAPYKYKEGKFKSFGSESYEFRYEMKGITEEQRQENIDAWRDMYKFVVTSTDEEFYTRLKEYFVIDSALYFYLFTERYTMVDNRAKNSFWHYGKVYITNAEAQSLGEKAGGFIIDDEQAAIHNGYRYDLSFGYDFDTSLGIDNTGKLVLTYGKEDSDYYVDGDPTSAYIYRAAESTFFCRLRDLFKSEMQGMFVNREDANAWSATSLINQWDEYQSQFPEELWRLDIQRKYIRTYKGVSIDNSKAGEANPRFLTEMMNGRKKYQRRMFERNQELYMATKYFGKTATQDQIMMRFNNPESYVVKPDFTLYLTPYSDMYIGVKFGNVEPVNFRAKAGVEYTIPYSIAADTADITLIYGASFIQAIGDLSKCYVGDNDFSKASRLQSLTIGSDIAGYANTYMKKISLGNNKLLEYLDIRNVTGLADVVDLSQCGNMLELYAQGSGATGVIFANGGKIQKFYIPSVISLTMKNLNYIEDFSIESYNNLQTLVIEHTPIIDSHYVVNSSPKLQTLRLIGLNWNIENTDILNRLLLMRGINNDGGEIIQSVLTGNVTVPVIRTLEALRYQEAWSDLTVVPTTVIKQFAVTFKNYDGTVLDVQYIDQFENAVDPITRAENPIAIPTKPSTISHNYTYDKWDSSFTNIIEDRTIVATYTESLREYTAQYVSKGTVIKSANGLYGDNIVCDDIPTYTAEEPYAYYLFNRWDKSGFLDNGFDANGVKTINAIFDRFEPSGAFNGKDLKDLSPVEIYAMNKLGYTKDVVDIADEYEFSLGYDFTYDDIESVEIIGKNSEFGDNYKSVVKFNGENYFDTGIQLFDEDKDFILAIDYKFAKDTDDSSVLAQCYQGNGNVGFKLQYNKGYSNVAQLKWGSTSSNVANNDKREMVVIRHKKGDSNLIVYNSNLDNITIDISTLTSKEFTSTTTLIFGCEKQTSTNFANYAIGNIYWAKIWYKDLGEDVCKNLASWTHENLKFKVSGFNRYYLSDNPDAMCSFSLLASHLLDRNRQFNTAYTSVGGWSKSPLKSFLNSRLYMAIPTQIRSLVKPVIVMSSAGFNTDGTYSNEVLPSDCYVTIPCLKDVDGIMSNSIVKSEPYNSESFKSIEFFGTIESRKMAFDGGDYQNYWLRSTSNIRDGYVLYVSSTGTATGFTGANASNTGVLIEISF